ncbi:efflux RND transporter periplasmic adaptor subunit [Pseudoalteromonas sp. MMG005]|uniref:efflux RND transporter periplasmic adaptor subunit n=1 Tax=Pseudoalteromonas sp. MMG005 TaxID=2822682 RepID=UPI001B3A23F5|nr:efflux RND transporter periplasmic adaptor subunit [Pseudoalteromonas sp. MMG005]MBQ4847728.1 efflux RND transporter periplasmic adaptor subunit [Pseudoalteromonas sp. MMG005]
MNKRKRILLPVAVLVISVAAIMLIVNNPPKNSRSKSKPQAQMLVEIEQLQSSEFTLNIASYGVVKPRTQSMLVAQVSGEVSYINDRFRDGGFFEKGDVLLRIDDRDYQAEVKISQATLLSAEQALLEEQARSEQAKEDWLRLGNGSQASELVLRKPQLAAQHANVLSAQAKLEKAQLALERTSVVAPFSGRVLSKKVDLGQVVSSNGQIAEIYAIDYVEIRLPINNRDLAFINLPERSREGTHNGLETQVTLTSDLVGTQQWHGQIIRTEGAISEQSQQLYVVAQIDDPYSVDKMAGFSIKIGQYVNAQITGKTLSNVIIIPNNAIYQGSYVYVLNNDNLLMRKDVQLAWQNKDIAIVKSGLDAGMRLVTTPLGQVSSGTKVVVINDNSEPHIADKRKTKGDRQERRNNALGADL